MTAPSVRRLRAWFASNEQVLAIAVSTVILMAGQGITSPILPLFARAFGVSTAVVGLTITSFALARLLANIPAGAFADARGRRLLLIVGPLLTAVGMVGSGLAVGIADLLVWRFVAGAGSAVYMTGSQLYILDVSPPERRGTNISYNQGALLLGLSIGPAVGGIVAEAAGLRAPFFLVGAMALGAAAYGYLRLPEPESHSTSVSADQGGGGWRIVRSGPLLLISVVSMMFFATRAGTRQTLVPLMAIDAFGMSEGELGSVLGAIALIAFLLVGPAGRASDRFGRKATIVPTGVIAVAGIVAMAMTSSTTGFVVAMWVLGMGTSLAGPSQYAFVAESVPDADRGRALGIYRSASDLGFLAAPPLLGALADATSITHALVVNAVVLGAVTLLFLVFAREPQREGPALPPPAELG